MVNIEQITSTLAKMPDQALQRYAQMHRDDPYIMSLAVSESKRRKEMRAAGQAQTMQPQPKVVDQAVAGMAEQPMPNLPEQQGIGSLPAAAQMNFADGGITGYAGGGDIFSQFDQQKADRLAKLNSQLAEIEPQLRAAASSGDPASIQSYSQQAQAVRNQINTLREEAGNRVKNIESLAAPTATTLAAPVVPASAQAAPSSAKPQDARGALNAAESRITQSQVPPSAPAQSPALRAPSAPAAKAEGLEAMQTRLMGDVNKEREALTGRRSGIVDEMQALRDKRATDYEAELAKRGDVFKGREERLAKQGEKLEGLGDKYMGLALLQAGAAMMTTPGGIGAALGKGVAVGSERYAAGMEKINAAQERFADAKDKLDDLRINREDLTSAERRKLKSEADSAKLEGKKFMYEGAVSDLGIKHKDVDSLFGALSKEQQSKQEMASREKIAGMQEAGAASRSKAQLEATMATPERLAFQGYLAKTVTKDNPLGDPAKAYEAMVTAKREPMTEEKLRTDWFDPIKRSQIAKDYPGVKTFDEYMAAVKSVGSTGAPAPSSGKVPAPPSGFKLNG